MAVGISRNGCNGDPVVQRLLSSLEQVCNKVDGGEEEKIFLQNLLQSKSFQALVYVHNKIVSHDGRDIHPVSRNAAEIAEEVLESITEIPNDTARELTVLLSGAYLKAFLTAHDQIAKKEFLPVLPEVPCETEEEEETVKIVQLVKSNEPLGATIKYDDASGSIIIARIMHGGAADRSGLIHVGDEVHEVNGISVRGKTPYDVVSILQSKEGTITFKLVPGEDCFPTRESRVRVKAHFDYDPMTDPLIPCKEAGLAFSKGDILHIVNQEDPNWWQARRHGERNCRAGLIPGRQLQERRLAAMRDMSGDDDDETIPGCQFPVRKEFRPRKIKKIMYDAKENDDFDREEIPTYEEVAKLYPRLGLHRPIVLIGPPGVGRNELKRRLVATDSDHYKPTIPHTSRPRKPWELDGKEYYFATREFMEEEIRQGRFVEHGEYKSNLYGTSLETVRSVINAGYVCVMTPHPQALKMLRTPELKPYVIFIKPPPFDQLKETRTLAHARSTFDESCTRGFTDEEFHEIVYNAHKIEYLYGHLCDVTIINDDLNRTFDELMTIVKRVEVMPQWVPASWVASS